LTALKKKEAVVHRAFPTPIRVALALCGALLLSRGVAAQQPGHDAREIPPTPGVTPIETPSSRDVTARPSQHTPEVTRTPAQRHSAAAPQRRNRRHEPAIAGGHGPGGPPPGAHLGAASSRSTHDPLQPRDVATWILFGVLVVALGVVTIRMLRLPRFQPGAFEPLDARDVT
jgi:hypothetical protein